MSAIEKIVAFLKIPMKILLPTLCLFSGFLIFANEDILKKLNLLEWSNENGFTFGLIFVISSCAIVVYIIWFIASKVRNIYFSCVMTRNKFKDFMKLNDTEQGIILYIYYSDNYTNTLDYSQPIVSGLILKGFLFTNSTHLVSTFIGNTALPIKVTLQPSIYQALEEYIPKMKTEIDKINNKILKTKKESKKSKLQQELNNLKVRYDIISDKDFFRKEQ